METSEEKKKLGRPRDADLGPKVTFYAIRNVDGQGEVVSGDIPLGILERHIKERKRMITGQMPDHIAVSIEKRLLGFR